MMPNFEKEITTMKKHLFLVMAAVFMIAPSFAADDSHHPHHVAVAGAEMARKAQDTHWVT